MYAQQRAGHFGDDFMGHMAQPTVSNTEGHRLVNKVKGQSH